MAKRIKKTTVSKPKTLAVLVNKTIPMVRIECRKYKDFEPGKHFLPYNIAMQAIKDGLAELIDESQINA